MQPEDNIPARIDLLAQQCLALRLEDQDAKVRRAVRWLLLDTVGCALAARGHPAVVKAARAAATWGSAQATGLGSGRPASLLGAIVDSGAAIRALDYNDFYWGPGIGGHPSDLFGVCIPLAEHTGASLAELLEAALVGYELYLRILDRMAAHGVFDHTGAMTAASAAAAARLLGLDADATTDALAIACVRGPAMSAMRHGEICEAKATAPATAGLSGVVAAQLAQAGIGGPRSACLGPLGLGAWLREPGLVAGLDAAEGFGSAIARVSIKRFACIGTAQSTVAAARDIHRQAAGRRLQQVQLRLTASPLIVHQTSEAYRRPRNRETADHSFFSLAAMTLCDGDLVPRQFAAGRYQDADVLAMSDRLVFDCTLPVERKGLFQAQLHATLEDGTVLEALHAHPPGHPLNPLQRDELLAKWQGCCAGVLDGETPERLAHATLDGPLDLPVRDWLAPLHTASSPLENPA